MSKHKSKHKKMNNNNKKKKSISRSVHTIGQEDKYANMVCEICSSGDPSRDPLMLLCDKCDRGYHMDCFDTPLKSVPRAAWFCDDCQRVIDAAVPKTERTILDFFKIVKTTEDVAQSMKTDSSDDSSIKMKPKMKRRKSSVCLVKKRKPRFKMPRFTTDLNKRLEQKRSLAEAMVVKDMLFDDDLSYPFEHCPERLNDSREEPSMQTLDENNHKVFMRFKEFSRRADYAPLLVVNDPDQGYVVEAAEDIPDLTLIAEYAGEVDTVRNRIDDNVDDMMDLIRSGRSSTSLVICPNRRGNIARFISGINNFTKESRKKANLRSARFGVNGRSRVILYANRDIKKGERLYYDYNALIKDQYPTDFFV
eukprot:GILK01007488.1.p1 GENE.GILK01007488.1~~GILK01007488.1.p1  ORF type:complete len:364 (+),score=60.91 GILK01007488.1:90-1181(+)